MSKVSHQHLHQLAALVRYPDDNHSLEWHPSHWLDLIEQLDRWFNRSPAAA